MQLATHVNHADRRIAQTANLELCAISLQKAMDSSGIVGFYGPIGSGKSISANYMANRNNACYIQLGSAWKKGYFAERLLQALGVPYRARDSVAARIALAGAELAQSRRPLIIDEFDHAVANHLVDLVRDVWEESRTAIMVIGEPPLAKNIEKDWTQFHSRTQWVPVRPTDLADARKLRELYCPDVVIHDDLLQRVVDEAKGSARSVQKNIGSIREEALNQGVDQIDLKSWGKRPLIKNGTQQVWKGNKWEEV